MKPVSILFRLDDLSARSSFKFEQSIISCFERYSVPITVGVIPKVCRDNWRDPSCGEFSQLPQEKIDMLKAGINTGLVEIALHGLTHKVHKGELLSEFSGLPLAEQASIIAEGKELLESLLGISVSTFIPPWNDCDQNTIRACVQQEIKLISASMTTPLAELFGLAWLPFTCELSGLDKALVNAKKQGNDNSLVVVMMHQYDFTDDSCDDEIYSMDKLENYLQVLSSDEAVSFTSFNELLSSGVDLGEDRAKVNFKSSSRNITRFISSWFASNGGIYRPAN